MSIATELTSLQNEITNARSAIVNKGGTVTSGGGTYQLASDIVTIPENPLDRVPYLYYTFYENDFSNISTFDISAMNATKAWLIFYYATLPSNFNVSLKMSDQMTYFKYAFCVADDDTTYRSPKTITLNFRTNNCTNFLYSFYNCADLTQILGTPLDLSSAVNNISGTNPLADMFYRCNNLSYVRFSENTIRREINFSASSSLTDETLVSIANGLYQGASKTINLSNPSKTRCNAIKGNVAWDTSQTYQIFTPVSSGPKTLTQFIGGKGWSIA